MGIFRQIAAILAIITISAASFAQDTTYAIPEGYVGTLSEVRKYALIIGVENYTELPVVKNAISDASGLRIALEGSSTPFNGIRYLQDVETADEIRSAVEELVKNAQPSINPSLIMIYFAGHGYQYNSRNFIAPRLARNSNLLSDGLGVSELIDAIESSNFSVGIVIIDACRDSQDGTDAEIRYKQRDAPFGPGFSRMDGGADSVYIFSTASNKLANSQSLSAAFPKNSPFSGPLIANVKRNSLSIIDLFVEIKTSMNQEGRTEIQYPVWGTSLSLKNIYIFPPEEQILLQTAAWERVIASKFRKNCVIDFLTRFPISPYSRSAHYITQHIGVSKGGENCSVLGSSPP